MWCAAPFRKWLWPVLSLSLIACSDDPVEAEAVGEDGVFPSGVGSDEGTSGDPTTGSSGVP